MSHLFYSWRGPGAELARLAETLGGPTEFWAADLAAWEMGAGLPRDWREQGCVFNERGELRWWKAGDDGYEGVLVSSEPVPGLEPLPGEWEAEEHEVFLQDLEAPEVAPAARRYPHGAPRGRIAVRIYRRDGTTLWVSPRCFVPEPGTTEK